MTGRLEEHVIDTVAAVPDAAARPAVSYRGWNAAVLVLVGAGFAALVWHRRWISDDGLIVLRTVRNLLAGAGPVFNAGERVEANTSTLWTYLVALPSLVASPNWSAVVLGLLCSVAGLVLACDAARRLLGARAVLPAGALVVLALPPFWDFGTSGLETGLITGWLGLLWWLLVRRLHGGGSAYPLAIVLGLAPLVRPDLALLWLPFGIAVLVLEPGRRLPGLAAAALALPAAYQVFRMGYYGLLVPETALAKEAGVTRWEQGAKYLDDLLGTYALWWAGLGLALALLPLRRTTRLPTVVVALVPVVSAVLLGLYVTWVGGDFMHGRMLLPALFCLLLPLMVVPLSRWTVVPVLVTALWAGVSTTTLRPAYGEHLGPEGIANERLYYVLLLGNPHPVTAADYVTHPMVGEGAGLLAASPRPSLAIATVDGAWYLYPAATDTLVWLNLGVAGELAPPGTRVYDGVGLVNPVAGHATGVPGGRIGHDKDLPPEWFLAEAGVTGDTGFVWPEAVALARQALACPATVAMLESVRAPLTPARFLDNLTGAAERTGYRFPRSAAAAAAC